MTAKKKPTKDEIDTQMLRGDPPDPVVPKLKKRIAELEAENRDLLRYKGYFELTKEIEAKRHEQKKELVLARLDVEGMG